MYDEDNDGGVQLHQQVEQCNEYSEHCPLGQLLFEMGCAMNRARMEEFLKVEDNV